jgi:hypothetical protein
VSEDWIVQIWDTSSGTCLQTLKGHSGLLSPLAFSHDSTRLVSVSYARNSQTWNTRSHSWVLGFEDGVVKIWDASSGACLRTLKGHSDVIKSVAFSHDSARLASASKDGVVKIWDASSGACLQTFKGHCSFADLEGFETQQPIYQGIGISSDRTWLTCNAQERLWLPSEYRPDCFAVSGRFIGIGTGSGKIWIFCQK